jgi:hypothetical protein
LLLCSRKVNERYGEDKGGKPMAHCLTWTDTWLKRDGKWQIIGVQDAQFPCK